MVDKSANGNTETNYRGSSREYPKSPEAGYNPGKSIDISASDLMAKNLSPSMATTKIPRQKL